MSAVNAVALLAAAGGDYQISRSVRLRSSASGNFSRTVGTPTNKDVWTISSWTKYSAGGKVFPLFSALSGGYYEFLEINAGGDFYWITRNSAGTIFKQYYAATGQRLFRDPSAWYHFVVRKTSALTLQFYVNGEEFTLTAQTVGSPSSSINTAATTHYLGYQAFNAEYADGYLTEVNFIDGQALTPSSFGETDAVTGVWKPKKYTGTYGTNGFYLNFSDPSAATAAAIGKDYSGNGNNWTPNNISVTAGVTYDSMLDVPTLYADGGNGRGNYAVLNPLDRNSSASVADGNLSVSTSAVNVGARATIGVNSGKWYWEVTVSAIGSTNVDIGVADSAWDRTYVGSASSSWGYFSSGQKYNNGSASSYGASYTTGDTIGVAFDADGATLTFYKNGSSQGQAFTGVSGSNPIFPAVSGQTSSALACNFGQRPFAYTPPTGFKALNTQNLPEPTIKKGNQYFDAKLWSGTGSSRSITGYAFAPDFVWIKGRSIATQHALFNTITGNTKILHTNSTSAEDTRTDQLTSFNSDGFSLGTDSADGWSNYVDGRTYVGWAWKESPSAGFDIVTYTGTGSATTVAHNLGVAPSMMIVKLRSGTGSPDGWGVYHASLGNTKALTLETTSAAGTSSTYWNSTSPTSSVFSVGTWSRTNNNGGNYVAYLFAEVAGFSKFGSYTGNGSADGPFVFCGFRPAFVMIKVTGSAGEWGLIDTRRGTFNVITNTLQANTSDAEISNSDRATDFLSNGFKLRNATTFNVFNVSGQTYIYAAFAEHPFKNSLAR